MIKPRSKNSSAKPVWTKAYSNAADITSRFIPAPANACWADPSLVIASRSGKRMRTTGTRQTDNLEDLAASLVEDADIDIGTETDDELEDFKSLVAD